MNLSRLIISLVISSSLLFVSLGCQPKPAPVAPTNTLPPIPVSHPASAEVTDFVDYTGQTNAVDSVGIRARVTGYLQKMDKPFKEGAEVTAGTVLFEIDPSPYQAIADQAHAQVAVNEAQQRLAKITYDRDRSLGSSAAISQQQLDQDKAALDAGEARTKAAEATLAAANKNLAWTHVTSPISGRISSYFYTPGNLVTADQTLLTTIVSMDQMRASFNVDQRTYDRFNQAKTAVATASKDGKGGSETPGYEVRMALEGEENFPWKGEIDFINNQISPSTGTITFRGVFKNKRTESGTWRMVPGMFVRIRLTIGRPHQALLVIDRAIGSNQGLKFVYVVDAENKIQERRVVTGALQENGLRVIEPWDEEKKTGLKAEDWVVVGGLPQLRPKIVIQPDQVRMPFLTSNDAESPIQGSRPQPPPPTGKKK